METEPAVSDESIVENSSYFIYEGWEKALPTGGRPGGRNYKAKATFYSATGNKIKTVEGVGIERRLDPNAPNPQPASYAIRYCPLFSPSGRIEISMDHMVFLDKNGNHIKSYPYNTTTRMIRVYKKERWVALNPLKEELDDLDLTMVHEKPEEAHVE